MGNSLSGAGHAAIYAGPTFLFTYLLTAAMISLPDPWIIDVGVVPGMVAMVLLATIVGSVIAFLPALFGGSVLGNLARALPLLRPLPAWLAAGGAIGWLFGFLFGAAVDLMLPLVVTSMASAAWCHRAWQWD